MGPDPVPDPHPDPNPGSTHDINPLTDIDLITWQGPAQPGKEVFPQGGDFKPAETFDYRSFS